MGNGLNAVSPLHAPLTTTESTYTTYCVHTDIVWRMVGTLRGATTRVPVSELVLVTMEPPTRSIWSIETWQVGFTFSYRVPSPLIKGFPSPGGMGVPPLQDRSTTAGEEGLTPVEPNGAYRLNIGSYFLSSRRSASLSQRAWVRAAWAPESWDSRVSGPCNKQTPRLVPKKTDTCKLADCQKGSNGEADLLQPV